jgi:hypothetical protein
MMAIISPWTMVSNGGDLNGESADGIECGLQFGDSARVCYRGSPAKISDSPLEIIQLLGQHLPNRENVMDINERSVVRIKVRARATHTWSG